MVTGVILRIFRLTSRRSHSQNYRPFQAYRYVKSFVVLLLNKFTVFVADFYVEQKPAGPRFGWAYVERMHYPFHLYKHNNKYRALNTQHAAYMLVCS